VVTTTGEVEGGGYFSCEELRLRPMLWPLLAEEEMPEPEPEFLCPPLLEHMLARERAAAAAAAGVAVVFDCCWRRANWAWRNCGEYWRAATAAAVAAAFAAAAELCLLDELLL